MIPSVLSLLGFAAGGPVSVGTSIGFIKVGSNKILAQKIGYVKKDYQ